MSVTFELTKDVCRHSGLYCSLYVPVDVCSELNTTRRAPLTPQSKIQPNGIAPVDTCAAPKWQARVEKVVNVSHCCRVSTSSPTWCTRSVISCEPIVPLRRRRRRAWWRKAGRYRGIQRRRMRRNRRRAWRWIHAHAQREASRRHHRRAVERVEDEHRALPSRSNARTTMHVGARVRGKRFGMIKTHCDCCESTVFEGLDCLCANVLARRVAARRQASKRRWWRHGCWECWRWGSRRQWRRRHCLAYWKNAIGVWLCRRSVVEYQYGAHRPGSKTRTPEGEGERRRLCWDGLVQSKAGRCCRTFLSRLQRKTAAFHTRAVVGRLQNREPGRRRGNRGRRRRGSRRVDALAHRIRRVHTNHPASLVEH